VLWSMSIPGAGRSQRQEHPILLRVEMVPVIRNIVIGISTDPLREARLYEYEHAVGLLVGTDCCKQELLNVHRVLEPS
jgi:hypothetical protein